MELCNECQKLGYCKALAAINKFGLTTSRIIGRKKGISDLFITTPDEKSTLAAEIKNLKADLQSFVDIQREDARLKGCPNLEDFP